MSIELLTLISSGKFGGNAHLATQGGLDTDIRTIQTKINTIIEDLNNGYLDVLSVGIEGGEYYGGNDSWLVVDGTNAPLVSKLRFVDADTGVIQTLSIDSGVVTVS